MDKPCQCPMREIPDHAGACTRVSDRTVLRGEQVLRLCAGCYLGGDVRVDASDERERGVSADFPGPLYERCIDPECPDAWAYLDPPADHYHYVGPSQPATVRDDP